MILCSLSFLLNAKHLFYVNFCLNLLILSILQCDSMHLGYIQENLMENQRDNDCLFIQNYDKQKEYIECYLLLKIVVYFRDFFFF